MAQNKIITKEIVKMMEKYPLYSQDGKGLDAKLLFKVFNPYGSGTWLITEAEKQEDGDYLLYGLCHLFEWEWGYVMLSDLLTTRINVFGCKLPLERDIYTKNCKVRDCLSRSEIDFLE